jgi:MacB-like periplasmic core domain
MPRASSAKVPGEEAHQRAKLEFGSIDRAKEACRDARGAGFLESLLGDLNSGFRVLRRSPGFASVAVLTLALGIGATTAVFSLVNAVLLRALPYDDPERLVFLYETLPDVPNVPWSPVNGDFYAWRKQCRSFVSLALFTNDRLNVSIADAAFRVTGSRVTEDFFRVLGVSPEIGRTVDDSDNQPGEGNGVVISHALWQSRFGGDPQVLRKEMLLNARPYRIIGVMPAGFAFPHGAESLETAGLTTDVWHSVSGILSLAKRFNGIVQQQYIVANPDYFPTVPVVASIPG